MLQEVAAYPTPSLKGHLPAAAATTAPFQLGLWGLRRKPDSGGDSSSNRQVPWSLAYSWASESPWEETRKGGETCPLLPQFPAPCVPWLEWGKSRSGTLLLAQP